MVRQGLKHNAQNVKERLSTLEAQLCILLALAILHQKLRSNARKLFI